MIGRTIGHYEVVSKLGEGGMGAVFKAKDTHLDRFVALKVLPHDKVSDPERKRRFTQEAKAASALNHPNIITIYDIASSDGVDYIAMEFVEGKTLEALIKAGPLKLSETIKYARQMADALAAAHAAGILHRDLKPANVMVRESGLVKVLDFGLAKLTDDSDTSETDTTRTMSSTRAGQILGTVAYMSPEQAEGKKLDFRSDIFSFGVVMYEMAAGTRAFPGDSQASVLAAVLRDDPRPISETRSDMPVELEQIISRCLRKDPARRVQTMADLKAALEDLPDMLTRSGSSAILTRTGALSVPAVPSPPPMPPSVTSSGSPTISSFPSAAAPPPMPVQTGPVFVPPPPPAALPPTFSGPASGYGLPPAAPFPATESKRRRSRKGWWWIAVVAIFAGPSLIREFRKSLRDDLREAVSVPIPSEVVLLKGTPLTGNSGTEQTPSFSPDGNQVVYSWDGASGGSFAIYKKSPGGGDPIRLTSGTQEDYAPAWAPNGETIAFLRRKGASDEALLIPAAGGAEKKVAEVSHFADRYGLAWEKDSQHLIVPDAPSGGPASLFVLDLKTGEKKRISKPSERDEGDFFPAVSPDGDNLVFVRNPGGANAALYTLDLTDEDSSPERIMSPKMETMQPVWTADGKQLIFASGLTRMLWRVQSDGSGKQMPLLGIGNGSEPAVASRGARLVYAEAAKGKSGRRLMLVENFK